MLEVAIGVAGTAKNTGKTTTTAAIIDELRGRNINIFLTSIGYDGENIDNITGLPKPKLRVEPGDIIATAEKCTTVSTAKLKVLEKTNINTPLGRVLITRVQTPGLVVTAGPNKSNEVRILKDIFHEMGPGVSIFDGALNRIAPMAETDGFILATGAAKTPDIPRLACETEILWRLCNTPSVPRAAEISAKGFSAVTMLSPDLELIITLKHPSLLTIEDVSRLFTHDFSDGSYLYVPGIISEKAINALTNILHSNNRLLYLTSADPVKLLVAGNLVGYSQMITDLAKVNILTGVARKVPLLAVTLNPFYPEYRFQVKSYSPAYVDPIWLELQVKSKINAEVFDVMRHGATYLTDTILTHAHRWENPQDVHIFY